MLERLSKSGRPIDEDEIVAIARRAVKSLRRIQDIPRHSKVMNMSHAELNLVLQECPESPYFAKDDWRTTKQQARKLVLDFVGRVSFGSEGPAQKPHETPAAKANKNIVNLKPMIEEEKKKEANKRMFSDDKPE